MIGRNLKYYRQLAGLSQDSLAELVGLSKMTISNYENNKREPDSGVVVSLADALNIKAAALLSNPVGAAVISHGDFRKFSNTTSTSIDLIFEQLDRYLGRVNTVLRIIGDAALPDTPAIAKIPFTDIESCGNQIRDYLSLSHYGPVGNIVDILENKGILVCLLNISDAHFSGMNGTMNGRPYIAVNGNMPAERQRFTLIHELVHMLFSFPGDLNIEKTVDGITGAFLFPRENVLMELGTHRKNILCDLRHVQREYGISMQSILIRAKQNDVISNTVYENHQKWISQNGYRKDEKSNLVPESSKQLEKLVIRAVSEEMINLSRASELLDKSMDETKHICLPEA